VLIYVLGGEYELLVGPYELLLELYDWKVGSGWMYGGGECVFLVKGVFLCVGVVLVCSLL
jgi:hypothetical protein